MLQLYFANLEVREDLLAGPMGPYRSERAGVVANAHQRAIRRKTAMTLRSTPSHVRTTALILPSDTSTE